MTSPLTEPDRSLLTRVRKLLDKAEGTDNPHEAAAFSAKAADLVARHRIDPDQLTAVDGAADELALLGNIADAHDVRMVFQSTPVGRVAFLAGRREDLDIVEVMYASLHAQVAAQMAGLRRATGAATQRERRAFLFGFADRIGELLATSAAAASAESDARADGGAATALAVQERRARVDEFVEREWGRVRSASRPAGVVPDGYLRGATAAERADVGRTRLAGRTAIGRGRS